VVNALTIDVEDWFHATYLGVPETVWPDCEPRVMTSTQRILDLLSDAGVRATFFILGCVAESAPEIVERIAAGGWLPGSCFFHWS
jgi:peptidoglycan/xylan/chitin deacetylase (PgdA/CDA1 family)